MADLLRVADIENDVSAVAEDQVAYLCDSISEIGLLNPIWVHPSASGFRIVAGRNRLEAARRLGWLDIPAIVTEEGDLKRELIEIDENLCRKKLSPADEARLTLRRKEIYEALHPEAAAGMSQAAGMNAAQGRGGQTGHDVERFTKAQSTVTGKSERSVRRAAARGSTLGQEALAKIRGTSLDKPSELDALGELPEESRAALIERAVAGTKVSACNEVKKQYREIREVELAAKQTALPQKRYGVIYADPGWRFKPWSRETGMDRAADNHYTTESTGTIASLPVQDIAADDCVLFMWATSPMLEAAFAVIKAWGFSYKTNCCWVKERYGTGYWFRQQHELLLVATRGNVPAPAPGTQFPSVIYAKAGDHSEKPKRACEIIEKYFPNLPKIELNRRGPARPGWDAWGNEAEEHEVAPNRTTREQAEAGEPSASGDDPVSDPFASLAPLLGKDDFVIPPFLRHDSPKRKALPEKRGC